MLEGRIGSMLEAAAAGDPPPPDGDTEIVLPTGPAHAVVAFTAHHVVATTVAEASLRAALPEDDLAAAMGAPFLAWLGEQLGAVPGTLDLVLAARGVEADEPSLPANDALVHPRIERSRAYRDHTEVYGDADAFVAIGRGLAARREVTIEVAPASRGKGVGRRLATASRSLIAADELLFAQVSPGNVASVRAFLAAGFEPVAAEVLFHPELPGSP